MSTHARADAAAQSIKARLLAVARQRGEELQFVLVRYGLERLLYRLSRSVHAQVFVLKGAMLFDLWSGEPHRATKDLDLLGMGAPDLERLATVFRDIVSVRVEDDGLIFDPSSVAASRIKEDAEYEGVRVDMICTLGTARLALQVDVGFGDAVTPQAVMAEYPSLLNQTRPLLATYPRETVVAEKLQAMVHLGLANSRMKDFFDLWFLSRQFTFEGPVVSRAVAATFARRGATLPSVLPLALTPAFSCDDSKQRQWQAFTRRIGSVHKALSLQVVVDDLASFLGPVLEALAEGRAFDRGWQPESGWTV